MIFPGASSAPAPTPAAYLKAARELAASENTGLRKVRMAVLSTFTVEMLAPYLAVEGARRGTEIECWFAPWGQLEQPVLEAGGALYAHQPEVVVILARIEELAPDLLRRVLIPAEELTALIGNVETRIESLLPAFDAIPRRPFSSPI